MDNLMKKQPTHKTTTTQEKRTDKKWVTLMFFGKETFYISKVFKHTPLQIAFKTKNSLQSFLNIKDKSRHIFSKSGIYQLICNDCGKKYTGRTGCSFGKRYKEHLQYFKYNNENSKFAQTAIETGHEFGKRNYIMSIKFLGKKGRHLDTIEKFYIYQETKNNNQINDKHRVIYNKIFEIILENRKES
jgi:hypothetical protein